MRDCRPRRCQRRITSAILRRRAAAARRRATTSTRSPRSSLRAACTKRTLGDSSETRCSACSHTSAIEKRVDSAHVRRTTGEQSGRS
eukprot:6193873-Pleurochrysis_carterae.AAC.2